MCRERTRERCAVSPFFSLTGGNRIMSYNAILCAVWKMSFYLDKKNLHEITINTTFVAASTHNGPNRVVSGVSVSSVNYMVRKINATKNCIICV